MRKKGDKLEIRISGDLKINRTTNSGAKFDNADLSNNDLIIEAKVKDKPTPSITKKEIEKLIAQAKKHNKEWLYIQECNSGTYVLLDYNFFLEILEKFNK